MRSWDVCDKKCDAVSGNTSCDTIKSEIMSNQQLPEELNQPITRNPEKRRVYSSFKGNVYGADMCHW